MTRLLWRGLILAALICFSAVPALAEEEPPPDDSEPQIFDIVFPVAGPNHYTDTWGAARSGGRTHEGTDIMADKGIPVVAAADGVVGWVGSSCCYLEVEHQGFETWYIHLNNDTYGTDDGQGWGIAPGIEPGVEVQAGQLLGWVGDSGNAEWSGPHLHFEIRINGTAVNSYESLLEATPPPERPQGLWNGFFVDDDGNVHETSIDPLAADGVTKGCNPPWNTRYCPDQHMTRGQVAAFIRRTLELPASETDYFTDDDATVFDGDINALMEAGIGFGCSEEAFCPNQPLLRDEMAEMLVRAFAADDEERYTNPEETNFFSDDAGNRFEESINRLMAADVTRGCNPPDNDLYCPDQPLSRAQMASFFLRALSD